LKNIKPTLGAESVECLRLDLGIWKEQW